MNLYLIIALLVGWGASLVGAAFLGADYQEGQQAKLDVVANKAAKATMLANQAWADDLGARLEGRFDSLRIINTTLQKDIYHDREIQTRVLDNPDCALPASTLRLLNRQRGFGGQEGSSPGQPAAPVPADGKAGGATAGSPGPAR